MKYISLLGLVLFSCAAAFGQTLSPDEAKKKIAEATPTALPQTTRTKAIQSDAIMLRLKGKVKSVTRWINDAETGGSWQFRNLDEYEENGQLIRSISFDHFGNPFMVRVYGYIDDKRVSSAGYITYPYDPPAPPAPREKGAPDPRDYRYTNSYAYKYGHKDRLIEQVVRANNGKVIVQTKFVYEGDQVKRLRVDYAGKDVIDGIDMYDPNGELIRTILPAMGRYAESSHEYKYDTFDANGNWVERTVTRQTGLLDGKQKTSSWTEKREITYY